MKEIIYVRFSGERDRAFAIRTEILEEEGRRFVRKTAMFPEGKAHLENIAKWEKLLKEQYRPAPFQVNACSLSEDGLWLEYLEEENLASYLDLLRLSGRREEARAGFLAYIDQVKACHQDDAFAWTEDFYRVFGESQEAVSPLLSHPCGKVTNIDLVCENLLQTSPPTVLDYEWTFSFPIPQEYLLYRIIHYFVHSGAGRTEFSEEDLLSLSGVDPALLPLFTRMEKAFQRYIEGSHMALRNYVDNIAPGVAKLSVEFKNPPVVLKAAFSKGDYFSTEDHPAEEFYMFFPFSECGAESGTDETGEKDGQSAGRIHVEGEAQIPLGSRMLWLEPGNNPGMLRINKLDFDDTEADLSASAAMNGRLAEKWVYFDRKDPKLVYIPVPEGAKQFSFSLDFYRDMETALHRLVAEQEKTGEEENYQATLDSALYEYADEGKITCHGWSYTGRAARSFRVQIGEKDIPFRLRRFERPDVLKALPKIPFPDIYPGYELVIPGVLKFQDPEERLRITMTAGKESFVLLEKSMSEVREEFSKGTVRFCIDVLEKRLDNIYVQGWCLNELGSPVMELVSEEGKVIEKARWKQYHRSDLTDAFHLSDEFCCGFQMEVKRKDLTGKNVFLVFKNELSEKKEPIDLEAFDRENSKRGRIRKVLSRENSERNRSILLKSGLHTFREFVEEEAATPDEMYTVYEKHQRPSALQLLKQSRESFPGSPLFSIVVPLYKTPENYLAELVDSVRAQSYGNWELCLADGSEGEELGRFLKKQYGRDQRIRYRHLDSNEGISGNTNQAIQMAGGDYIVFADHDDFLTPDALYENMKLLSRHPEAELIYSDEDLTNKDGVPYDPHFKPDFNPEYLCSINYICHLVVVKRELLQEVGPLDPEYDGAQDYEFLLRCIEKTDRIFHIPRVLYHWRSHQGSTAGNEDNKQYAIDAGRKALLDHYRRMGIEAEVEYTGFTVVYRTRFQVKGKPKVSILIPNKDHVEDLSKCVESVMEKSSWKNKELVIIENNSTEEETFLYYKKLHVRYPEVKVVTWRGPFNYSAINNFGAASADGDFLLLLNNDTEVISPDWLERLISTCQQEGVGAAGAKLFYPDNTVQHAGVVIGFGGIAGHLYTNASREDTGYMRRLVSAQAVSAVTGACMMVRADLYRALQGLDEEFAVAFNDVDFCLRIREAGYRIVFLPDVWLYHYESKSRGYETTPEKIERFQGEIRLFREKYKDILEKGDPYYNPNLSLVSNTCQIKKLSETLNTPLDE